MARLQRTGLRRAADRGTQARPDGRRVLPTALLCDGVRVSWRCSALSTCLGLYQLQTTPDAPYRQPGTLREVVFLCGVVLGMTGREMVIKLSVALGGLGKHKPLVNATLDWLNCTSLKLVPPKDRLPTGRLI